jgi:hypothetical protein
MVKNHGFGEFQKIAGVTSPKEHPMRYRKSIRLAKGLRINVSKSGFSLTAGIPGLSMNVGKQGAFLNTGIPGTGIYDRKRITGTGGRSNNRNQQLNQQSSQQSNQQRTSNQYTSTISLDVTLDDQGKPIIRQANGLEILDTSLVNRIKRSPEYKAHLAELIVKRKSEIDQATEQFIHSYRLSPSLLTQDSIEQQLSVLQPRIYYPQAYPKKPPTQEDVQFYLEIEAKQQVRTWKFWQLSKLRSQFVQDHLGSRLQQEQLAYQQAKSNHETEEQAKKREQDARYLAQYNQEKQQLENWLQGPATWVEKEVEELLASISLPVEFGVDYEYEESKGLLKVDLDLPEIEDLPTTKARVLASGKLSVKEKSKKELTQDYATCVAGLPFFFASHMFNLCGAIETIVISGYTQRNDPSIGHVTDQYVVSVAFTRDIFCTLNLQSIDPLLALTHFSHRFQRDRSGMLKVIEPLDP